MTQEAAEQRGGAESGAAALPAARPRRALLGMGAVTAGVLIYEIAITRVLSVVLWYHFAFLSISLAMLGLGAAGVWFSLRRPGPSSLRVALLASGIAMPVSVVVIVKVRPLVSAAGLGFNTWVVVIVLSLLVPMIALGSAVCLLLMRAGGRRVARMYCADLVGATLGAAAVVPLMYWVPTPILLASAGLLPLFALGLLYGWRRPALWAPVALVVAVVLWGEPVRLRYTKLYYEAGSSKPLHEVWTPPARITVFDHPLFAPDPSMPWGWGYGTRYQPTPRSQLWIDQDGSAGTPIEKLVGPPGQLQHLLYDVTSVGYQLRAPRRACIIGVGGGRDVLCALASGVTSIDAVEMNPAIVNLLSGPLRQFCAGCPT